MADEQWAEVNDFPNYAVSTFGRVMNVITHQILRPRYNSYGYARVALRKDGVTYDVYVHRLVAAAFMTGYHEGVSIRHTSGNGNNHINTLRFLKGERVGTFNKKAKRPQTRRIRIVETQQVFLTVESCANYIDGDVSSIYRVLRGERSHHKGLTFEMVYEEHDG